MFTRGLAGRGMAGLGEFKNEARKVEYWLPNTFGSQASIIPGLAPTTATAAVAAGGTAVAAGGIYLLGKYMKWW